MFNTKYEAAMSVNRKEENKLSGLSEYSQGLMNHTKELTEKLFPKTEDYDNEEMIDCMAINKELFRTCLISLLEGMSPEEQTKLQENVKSIKDVLLLSLEKASFENEDKQKIKEVIESLTDDDISQQIPIIDKLDLLNLESPVCKLSESLYKNFEKNSDATEAHAYLNLTEK